MFSIFFINRPIFASVISILLVLFGAIAFLVLPMEQFPDITPPEVRVSTAYPGASAETVAATVGAPIEQQVNGVEDMLYMASTSSADGSYELTVTFALGTDIDIATVLVQNRVAQATPKLPEEVRTQGVTTQKQSTNMLGVITLYSDDGRYDELFLANYALINLKDELSRIPGVSRISYFPDQDYGMRLWLDPTRMQARGVTTEDVIAALKEQNVQVAAGQVGQPPAPAGVNKQFILNTKGRLETPEEFGNIILKTSADGGVLRVKDIARVELGAKQYFNGGRRNGQPAAVLIPYGTPGGNTIQAVEAIKQRMEELSAQFPAGLKYEVSWNAATFVEASMTQVEHTLIEAFVLVLIVVLAFLHNWRATLIPMLAIPVSIVGTFAVMLLLGFSINMLTMFGLILAIGIVVDDAILVVENAERIMHHDRLDAKEATKRAMLEIAGPIIAVTLVLMAVFLPSAMLPGLTGQLYRQFAATIAVATGLSAIVALTLSPALAGALMKASGGPKGWYGRTFDRLFDAFTAGYTRVVRWCVQHLLISGLAVAALLAATYAAVTHVPTGFLPQEDELIVLVDFRLPANASFARTLAVTQKMEQQAMTVPGVAGLVSLPGYGFISKQGLDRGGAVIWLKPWDERTGKTEQLAGIVGHLRKAFDSIQEARFVVFTRPSIPGLGLRAGFDMQLQDRAAMGPEALGQIASAVVDAANGQSSLRAVYTPFVPGIPQLFLDIDREKIKKMGLPLSAVFNALQTSLGSAYINDFNLYGRTWQVRAQAEAAFRNRAEDVLRLEVRAPSGETVPLGAVVQIREAFAPDQVTRYNLYRSAGIQGEPAPGVSSGQALQIMQELAQSVLPPGISYAWTGISYQEKQAGSAAILAFGLAVLVVYLILAAQYEAWTTPLAVVFTVPVFVLAAMLGLMLRGMDNGLYAQVGLVLLVGLGAKNAILIVEFAREAQSKGMAAIDAAVEAARLRLRPILMTSFAFIAGLIPLLLATGAGAASRQAVATAVAFGMLGGTLLGVFVTPVMYSIFQTLAGRPGGERSAEQAAETESVPTGTARGPA